MVACNLHGPLLNATMRHDRGHLRQILSPTRIIRNWIDCADWVSATEYRLCMVCAALHRYYFATGSCKLVITFNQNYLKAGDAEQLQQQTEK